MNVRKTGWTGILVAALLALIMVSLPGSAAAKDRNRDRIPDRWEKRHKLSLKKNQRKRDQDHDGLRNRGEWLAKTNPRDRDSDDDGTPDGKENAGFVASYDAGAGTLTITLYAGGQISGTVSDRTEVECEGDATGPAGSPPGARTSSDGALEGKGESRSDDEADHEDGSEDHESEDSESEDHESENHDGSHGSCSIDDLAEGVVVHEAEVRLKADGAFFRELEIEKRAAAG